MSAGTTHIKASVALAGGFLLGSFFFGNGIPYAIGSLVGILVSPDLDVDAGNVSNTLIKQKVGLYADMGWRGLWYQYSASIKHGSPLSHFPIIGTLGRVIYLFGFLIVLPYMLAEMLVPGAWNFWYEVGWWQELLVKNYKFILGLMGSDLIHYFLDILTKESTKKGR